MNVLALLTATALVLAQLIASSRGDGSGLDGEACQPDDSRRSISRSSWLRNGETYAPGDLIFEDNFDTFNASIWSHEANMNGGSNGEFQIYGRYEENTYVKDGVLYIKPTLTVDLFGGDTEKLYNGYHYMECCSPLLDPPSGEGCDRQAAYPDILPPVVSARLRSKLERKLECELGWRCGSHENRLHTSLCCVVKNCGLNELGS